MRKAGEKSLTEADLDGIFEVYWPRLEEELEKAKSLPAPGAKPPRPQEEIMEEIMEEMLELLRQQDRRLKHQNHAITSLFYRAVMKDKDDSVRFIDPMGELIALVDKGMSAADITTVLNEQFDKLAHS